MKKIIASMLANDLVNIERRWLDIRAILKNKGLHQQIVEKMAEKSKNADFILLEAGNEESIFWGTLVALNCHKNPILRIEEIYNTINISDVCWSLESTSEGYPKSFERSRGFNPAEKNDMAIVVSAISSTIFPGEYRCDEPGSMIIEPKIRGNSTAYYRDGNISRWGFNISGFLEERPDFTDKKIFSGFSLSKEYQERIRSNMIVLQNTNLLGEEDSLMSWQEIAEYERVLMNPIK